MSISLFSVRTEKTIHISLGRVGANRRDVPRNGKKNNPGRPRNGPLSVRKKTRTGFRPVLTSRISFVRWIRNYESSSRALRFGGDDVWREGCSRIRTLSPRRREKCLAVKMLAVNTFGGEMFGGENWALRSLAEDFGGLYASNFVRSGYQVRSRSPLHRPAGLPAQR